MTVYTVGYLKTLPVQTLKKMLREAGYTQREVGRLKRPPCSHVSVNRVIRKQQSSQPVWEQIAWCLNHPKRELVVA
jgi:hypothetical protein